MRDVLWRMGFTLAALGALLLVGPGVGCNLDNRLLELLHDPTPQAEIDTYLAAIAEGARQAALDLWFVPGPDRRDLQARREAMTEELLGYGPRLEYRVLDVEFLAECCESTAIADARSAEAARYRVAIRGEDRPETIYLFDVLFAGRGSVGDGGETAGWTAGQRIIVDVYAQDEAPLAWTRR